jgi:hypothetical protein
MVNKCNKENVDLLRYDLNILSTLYDSLAKHLHFIRTVIIYSLDFFS